MLRTYRRAARDVDECWVRTAGFLQQFKRNPQEIRTRSSATFAEISQLVLIQHARREKRAAGLQQLGSIIQRVRNQPLEGPKSTLGGSKIDPRSPREVQEQPEASQERPKSAQERPKRLQVGPKRRPRGSKLRPRDGKLVPRSAKLGPRDAKLGPRTAKLGFKLRPRGSKLAPRSQYTGAGSKKATFGRFWKDLRGTGESADKRLDS